MFFKRSKCDIYKQRSSREFYAMDHTNKRLIYWLIWILPFSVFATDNSCPKPFSLNNEINSQQKSGTVSGELLLDVSMNQIAQLDLLTLNNSRLPKDDFINKPELLYLHVFRHPDLFNKYTSERGLFLYAKVYSDGDIQQARQRVQDHLSDGEFQRLGWHNYKGPIWVIYKKYNWQVVMNSGRFIFKGMEGYALIADLYFNGNMAKAFDETLAMSGIDVKKFMWATGWKRVDKYTSDFYQYRRKVTNHFGNIFTEYRHEIGLDKLVRKFHEDDRLVVYTNMESVLNSRELEYLKWPAELIKKPHAISHSGYVNSK